MEKDPVTGLAIPHISFILRHFLPMSYSCRSRQQLRNICKVGWYVDPELEEKIEALPTGSLNEGLDVPFVIQGMYTKPIGQREMKWSDVDIMMVMRDMIVTDPCFVEGFPNNDKVQAMEIFTENTHPGYLQLRNPIHRSVRRPAMWVEKGDGYRYYSPVFAKKYLQDDLLKLRTNNPTYEFTEAGPALNTNIPQQVLHQDYMADCDMVFPVFVCPKWPKVAEGWKTRHRPSGWPDQTLVDEIINDGCHVVPVSHPFSDEPDLEWRMSFSSAELKIASNINKYQRQAYLLLKVLHRQTLKEPKALVTYHLKTTFYWMLEKIPPGDWSAENIGPCLMSMIDFLHTCMKEGCIKSYFTPENNLIDRVPKETCEILASRLEDIRADPFKYLFEFNKVNKWYFGLFFTDAESFFKPVLEDALTTTDMKQSGEMLAMYAWLDGYHHLLEQGYTLANALYASSSPSPRSCIYENVDAYANALDFIEDSVRIRKTHLGQDTDVLQFVRLCIARLNDKVDCRIGFSEYVLKMYPESEQLTCLRSDLACLYHANSLLRTDETVKEDLRKRARDHFDIAISKPTCGLASKVDYCLFLDKSGDYTRIVNVLDHDSVNLDELNQETNGYRNVELDTLDKKVQQISQVQKEVNLFAQSLASYLIVKANQILGNDTTDMLASFKRYCDSTVETYGAETRTGNAYILLTFAYETVGMESDSFTAREKAKSILGDQYPPSQTIDI